VLGGKLSPLNGVGPEDLRITELEARLGPEAVHEVILALGSDVEGDATASYLAKRLATARTSRQPAGAGASGGRRSGTCGRTSSSRALEGRRDMP
jgi:recombination protein RecR